MTDIDTVMITCPKCGVLFWLTSGHIKHLRETHDWFYCPNQHPQKYAGKTEAERLEEELSRTLNRLQSAHNDRDRYREQRDHHQRRVASYKGHFNRLKNKQEEQADG